MYATGAKIYISGAVNKDRESKSIGAEVWMKHAGEPCANRPDRHTITWSFTRSGT